MIIDFLRHGDTGRKGFLDGRTDPPLLAQTAAALLEQQTKQNNLSWQQIICSPRLRCVQTAKALKLTVNQIEPDWAEYDFGQWDGVHSSELNASLLNQFYEQPERFAPPDAEPWPNFKQRIQRQLLTLASRSNNQSTLVITHGGTMRMVLELVLGWSPQTCWSLRLDYGTRLRLQIGLTNNQTLWGHLVELAP